MCHNFFPQKKERRRKKEMLEYTLNTFDLFSSYTYSSLSSKTSGGWESSLWFFWPGFVGEKERKNLTFWTCKSRALNWRSAPKHYGKKQCIPLVTRKIWYLECYICVIMGQAYPHGSMHYISTQLNMAIKHTFQQKLGTYIIVGVNIFCKSS